MELFPKVRNEEETAVWEQLELLNWTFRMGQVKGDVLEKSVQNWRT